MKKLAGPLLSLGVVLLSLICIELSLAKFAPLPDPYESLKNKYRVNRYLKMEYPPNIRIITEAETGLPGVSGSKAYSTNNLGYRGEHLARPKPAGEFRIFLIGGSTAECFYLDDSESLETVLQAELRRLLAHGDRIKVYNTGRSGARSDDHAALLVHQIAHLEPDLVVVFAGVNDLTASIYNLDYLHRTVEAAESETEIMSLPLLVRMVTSEFQIPRRFYRLFIKAGSRREKQILEQIPTVTDYRDKVELRRSMPVSEAFPRVDTLSYRNNLQTMVGFCLTHQAQLVFMTQQSTWDSPDPGVEEWHWLRYRNGVNYRPENMNAGLEMLNEEMRKISRDQTIPLYDLAVRLPKTLEYFYDDIHFNVKGAGTAARELAALIIEQDIIKPGVLQSQPIR
jgi:lysophospholipase L1-like esterase